MLHEHLGTTSSEDVVMLSEAVPLWRCNVLCQLQTIRAGVTVTMRSHPSATSVVSNGLQSFAQEWSCQHPFLPRLPRLPESRMGSLLLCCQRPGEEAGAGAVRLLAWVCICRLHPAHICLRDTAGSPRSVLSSDPHFVLPTPSPPNFLGLLLLLTLP